MRYFLSMSFLFLALLSQGAQAHVLSEKEKNLEENLLIISPSSHNFFFNSVLDKLITKTGFDYVPVQRPAVRALREIENNLLNIAGPYAQSLFQIDFSKYKDDFSRLPSGKWLVRWEKILVYAVTLKGAPTYNSLDEMKKIRVGFLTDHFNPTIITDIQSIRAKSVKQLIALLQSGRVQVILLSRKHLNQVRYMQGSEQFSIGNNPVQSEQQYLYISPRNPHFMDHFKEALIELRATQYYKVRREMFGESAP